MECGRPRPPAVRLRARDPILGRGPARRRPVTYVRHDPAIERSGERSLKTTGAKLLTSVLADAGVEIVAGIPGHTIFSFANAVPEQPALRPLLGRHEAGPAVPLNLTFLLRGSLVAVFAHSIPGTANAAGGDPNAHAGLSDMLL